MHVLNERNRYMTPFLENYEKSKTIGTENKPVVATFWKQREEVILKRHKKIQGYDGTALDLDCGGSNETKCQNLEDCFKMGEFHSMQIFQFFKNITYHATIKIEKDKKHQVMVSLSTLYFIQPLLIFTVSSSGETWFLQKLINLQYPIL